MHPHAYQWCPSVPACRYFYSFNGCSNQDLALSFDGRQTVMEYMMW